MFMVVGVCRVILNINEAFSLKEKRQVVKVLLKELSRDSMLPWRKWGSTTNGKMR